MKPLPNIINEMANTYLEKNGWNEWAKYVLMSLEELKKQHSEDEAKIEVNKEAFIHAINDLQLTVTKEIGTLTSEIKVIKKQLAIRSIAWSSIVPIGTALIYALVKLIK